MKKLISVLIVTCLLCTSCAQNVQPAAPEKEPASDAAAAVKTDDSMLLSMEKSLAELDNQTTRIDLGSEHAESHKTVRVTKELLAKISEAVTTGGAQKLEKMGSISGEVQGTILQGRTTSGAAVALKFFSAGSSQYPENSVLWLQNGEESAQYVYPKEFYGKLDALVRANLVDELVTMEGNYTELPFPRMEQDSAASETPQLLRALQFESKLVCLYNIEGTSCLQMVDMNTGEVLEQINSVAKIDRIEKLYGDAEGYAYRAYSANGYADYHAEKGKAPREFRLPEAVSAKIAKRFQGRSNFAAQDGQLALTGEDGIYLADSAGDLRRVLSNEALPVVLQLKTDSLPDGFSPNYMDPHFLNGGKQLAAVVELPGSQCGFAGLAVLNIATGEVTHFTDVFSAMVAQVFYPDDKTIAAQALESATLIDAETLKTTVIATTIPSGTQWSDCGSTQDYKMLLACTAKKGEDGILTRNLYTVEAGKPEQKMPILMARGEHFSLCGNECITENYAVCSYEDREKAGRIVVKYR